MSFVSTTGQDIADVNVVAHHNNVLRLDVVQPAKVKTVCPWLGAPSAGTVECFKYWDMLSVTLARAGFKEAAYEIACSVCSCSGAMSIAATTRAHCRKHRRT